MNFSGSKPFVEEKGPYVYKSITVKDSDDNMQWHDSDGTLTYRYQLLISTISRMLTYY